MTGEQHIRRFALQMAFLAAVLSFLPYLFGLFGTPAGSEYLGYQFSTDDHMVYSAWMRQAMDGRLLFDNRFAIDPQPGLTLHLYFLVLGWVAKVAGIGLTSSLAKAFFSALFVWLTSELLMRMKLDVYPAKLGLALVTFGAGIGFAVWHNFGRAITKDSPAILKSLLGGGLPTDVWQPEGFVFSSMLTNGLFMVSLCLSVGVLLSMIDAYDSWKPVGVGALCFGLLMNIHSYDVMLMGLVALGFLVCQISVRDCPPTWIVRVLTMTLGTLTFALWFMHVLQSDAVFQARAATPTVTPNFKQILFAYVLFLIPALFALAKASDHARRAILGVVGTGLGVFALYFLSSSHEGTSMWMSWLGWGCSLVAVLALCSLLASSSRAMNLVTSWALVGLIAPYFPALFQRKLAMGLSVPWAILAAVGIGAAVQHRERSARNLMTLLVIILFSGTSVQWLLRERMLAARNTSNTTVHPVYISKEVGEIVNHLSQIKERTIVICPPGIPSPETTPDTFGAPYMPDLNPILSGLAGVYSFAGHWSETPDYLDRRNTATMLYLKSTSDDERAQILAGTHVNYVIAPIPGAFPQLANELIDARELGEVVVGGAQFALVKIPQGP